MVEKIILGTVFVVFILIDVFAYFYFSKTSEDVIKLKQNLCELKNEVYKK